MYIRTKLDLAKELSEIKNSGMIFVYIEQMILTCSPHLADRLYFNFIFALLLLPFQNIIMLFCLYAHVCNDLS